MTVFFVLFGSLMLAGAVAFLFEKWDITHNGIVPSILIAFGAVFAVFMFRIMFNFSLGSPGVDAIVGAAAALILLPTEWANKRRSKDRRR